MKMVDLQAAIDDMEAHDEAELVCTAPAAALGRPRHSLAVDADGTVVCTQCRLYISVNIRLALYRLDLAWFEGISERIALAQA